MKPRPLLIGGTLILVVLVTLAFLHYNHPNNAKSDPYLVSPSAWLNYCHIVGVTPVGQLLASYTGKYWQQAYYVGSNFADIKLPENGPLTVREVSSGKVIATIPAEITLWPMYTVLGGTKLAAIQKGPVDKTSRHIAESSAVASALAITPGKFGLYRELASRPVDKITVWDVSDGRELIALPHPWKVGRAPSCLKLTPAGDKLACSGLIKPTDYNRKTSQYECIHLWDLNTGKLALTLKTTISDPNLNTAISDIVFSPDGKLLTCGGLWGLHIWDATSGHELVNNSAPDVDWWHQFTDDSHILVIGDKKGFRLWDVVSSKPCCPQINCGSLLTSNDILNHAVSGKRIAATVHDSSSFAIKIWDAETGRELGTVDDIGNTGDIGETQIHDGGGAMQFLNQSNLLAVAHNSEKQIKLWDLSTFKEFGKLDAKGPLVVSHDGKQLFTQSADGQSLLIWDVESLRTQPRSRPIP